MLLIIINVNCISEWTLPRYSENCEVIHNKCLKHYKNLWNNNIDVHINGSLKVTEDNHYNLHSCKCVSVSWCPVIQNCEKDTYFSVDRYHNHHSLRCFATTVFSTEQESNRTEFAQSLIWECGRQFWKLLTKWPSPMNLLCHFNVRTFLFIYSVPSPFVEFHWSKANVGKEAFDMGQRAGG